MEDEVQQVARILVVECRRRFVEDQELDLLGERLGDFHELLLAHADVLDRGDGIFAQPHAGQEFRGLQVGLAPVHPAALGLFVAEVDVLGNGQVGAQCQFLVDDNDAALLAVTDAGKIAGFVFKQDRPVKGVVRVNAGQHLHQGGFSRPVFTADSVYLAAVHVQGDVLEGLHAWEGLGDSSHLKNGCFHRQFPLTCRN